MMGPEGDDRGYAIYLVLLLAMVVVGFVAQGAVGWKKTLGMALAWVGIFALLYLLASAFLFGRAMG